MFYTGVLDGNVVCMERKHLLCVQLFELNWMALKADHHQGGNNSNERESHTAKNRGQAAATSPALPLLFLCASHHIPIKINYMPKSESLGKRATNGKM